MISFLLARILNVGLHLTIVGSLVNVDFQLHHGRAREALIHTSIVCVCILMLAVVGYIAMRLLGKDFGKVEIKLSPAPSKKSRSTQRAKRAKGTSNRKDKKRQR